MRIRTGDVGNRLILGSCSIMMKSCESFACWVGNYSSSFLQHVKDKFWNFVFYKFIFIFGVMNAQEMEEIVLWCTWFSILGFLHILAQLCKDRFEYVSRVPRLSPCVTTASAVLWYSAFASVWLVHFSIVGLERYRTRHPISNIQ